ncbi:MAG: cadherin-like beta sandwich domain-containing protein [Bacilli bacterium]
MKKNLYICLLLILFILPSSVAAATGNLKISCADTTLNAGESTECTITGSSSVDIIDISTVVELSSNLTMESFTLNNTWEGSDFDTGKIDIYTKSGDAISGNFTVGVMTIKVKSGIVNSNEKVTLSSIEFTYDTKEYSIDDVSASIRVPNNVNTLSNLSVSGATFNFNANTFTYNFNVDAESTTINATKLDSNSVVTGDIGNKNLSYGLNTFKITVAAENGTTKTYTLNVTRPDNRSSEKDLLAFQFIGYDIKFNKEKTDYTLSVENNITSLAICAEGVKKDNLLCINRDAVKYSDKANMVGVFNDVDFTNSFNEDDDYLDCGNLNVGKNKLLITVKAENETENTYTFIINRKDEKGNLVDDELTTNNKTGDSFIIVVCVVAILSLIVSVYYVKKKNKAL